MAGDLNGLIDLKTPRHILFVSKRIIYSGQRITMLNEEI
jgi:hypothetical protein